MADNKDHYFWYTALTAASTTAANGARINDLNPTNINTFMDDVLTSQTDVEVQDADYTGAWCGGQWLEPAYPNGWIGFAYCRALSGSKCQQFVVYFDTDYMGPSTAAQELALACHEFGHTVGLTHATATQGGCMQTGPHSITNYSNHDRDSHLNVAY